MRFPFRPWLLLPLLAFAVLAWSHVTRARRIQHLTATPEWSVDRPAIDPTSITGWTDGRRMLVLPDRTGQSQQWLVQAQQALERRAWRLRHVDFDNAPYGRATHLPLLYRSWLVGLAAIDATLTGAPAGAAVERAALYADPLLAALFVIATAWLVRRRGGGFSSWAVAILLAGLYPLGTIAIAGAPDTQVLAEACVLWSILPLALAIDSSARPVDGARSEPATLFLLAGVAGGIGLWVSPSTELPVIAGLGLGAIATLAMQRGQPGRPELPWRTWALGGCAVSLMAYAAEYYPADLGLRLLGNHPLYAVAWWALGELLHRCGVAGQARTGPGSKRARIARLLLNTGLVAVVLVALASAVRAYGGDLTADRLTRLRGGFVADDFAAWWTRDGLSLRMLATVLPVALLVLGFVPMVSSRVPATRRGALVVALAPLLVAVALGCAALRWWTTAQTIGVALVAVAMAAPAGSGLGVRWKWGLGLAASVGLGTLLLLPPRSTFRPDEFTPTEMQAVVERDLAHWLAQRHAKAIVFAPPNLTTALCFHGGLRGLATFDPDNGEGFRGALRIAAASTDQEALTLIQQRGVTHVVLPAGDLGLDEAARQATAAKAIFIEQLRAWIVPRWLRPISYYAPGVAGFEAHTLAVFEVVPEQREPELLSYMATYFLESGLLGHATQLRPFLQRYPTDLGARISLAEIELARGDATAFGIAMETVLAGLASGADRALAWERRVALAAVLERHALPDLARGQLEQCCARADEAQLRALSARSLFRFLALLQLHGLDLPEPRLRDLAKGLLPPESRARL